MGWRFAPLLLLCWVSACTTNQDFVFGPVIHIDAPWRYSSPSGAPVTLGVVHGNRHSVALEALTFTPVDLRDAAKGALSPEELQEAEARIRPHYVALLRRDEGEKLAARPGEEDALRASTPHLELSFDAGHPSLGGVRLFALRSDRSDTCKELLPAKKACFPSEWPLERKPAIGPVVGWVRALSTAVASVVAWPVRPLRALLWQPVVDPDERRSWLDEMVADPEREPGSCYERVDGFRLRCEDDAHPCYWRAELVYWRPSSEVTRNLLHVPATTLYAAPRAIPALLSRDYEAVWGNAVEYRDSMNTRLRYTKILRTQHHEPKERECEKCEWVAGDTHVHTRHSDHFAESGHGIEATGKAASEIGLGWLTTTDHANDARGLGMDRTAFEEQAREIRGYNDRRSENGDDPRATGSALLIQGEEVVVARRYDDTDNVYHLLTYQWSEPSFVSGRIEPVEEQVGISEVLQIFTGNAPQGRAQRTIEEIAGQHPPSLGFALIAHPEEDYLERAVKLQRKWTYEDFEVALALPSIRGMELWNTDVTEARGLYSFWERNTPDFGRFSSLGLARVISFIPLAATNVVLSPFTIASNALGSTNSPPLWGASARFDIEIDPRFDTSTPLLPSPRDWDRFVGSGFRPSYWASGNFGNTAPEFLDSSMPWAQAGMYDFPLSFGYGEFASLILGMSALANFDSWLTKRRDDGFVDNLEDIAASSVRLAFWIPGMLSRDRVMDGHCVVELPFRGIRGDDSFWSRELWTPKPLSERCPSVARLDPEQAGSDSHAAFSEQWPTVLRYASLPRVSENKDEVTVRRLHEQDWYAIRERAATRRWVELFAGIDLWDYGLVKRAARFLERCPSSSCPLQSSSTARIDDLEELKEVASPLNELRFVAAAGTDAHGGFNYSVGQPTLYEINIDNNALGKVRTVVRLPEQTDRTAEARSEHILLSLAAGASYLSNGPHADLVVSGPQGRFPVGSVVVGSFDELARMRLEVEPGGFTSKSVRLYTGAVTTPGALLGQAPPSIRDYDEVFRRISREGAEEARLLQEFRYEDFLRRYADFDERACKAGKAAGPVPQRCGYEFIAEFQRNVPVAECVVDRLLKKIVHEGALVASRVYPSSRPGRDDIDVRQVLTASGIHGGAAHRRVAYVRLELDRLGATDPKERGIALTNPIWFVIEPDGSPSENPLPMNGEIDA